MRNLHSKKITKQIIVIIAIIMLCNFTMPVFSYAVSTQEGGSELEKITKLLCFIPDVVNNLLQNMFVTPYKIYVNDLYRICYSPGIIFSGMVPGLSVNFIEPMEDTVVTLNDNTEVLDYHKYDIAVHPHNVDDFVNDSAHTAAEFIARNHCKYIGTASKIDDIENFFDEYKNDDGIWDATYFFQEGGREDFYINGTQIIYSTQGRGTANEPYDLTYYIGGYPGYKSGLISDEGTRGQEYVMEQFYLLLVSEFGEENGSGGTASSSCEDEIYEAIINSYYKIDKTLATFDSNGRVRDSFVFTHKCSKEKTLICVEYVAHAGNARRS